MSGFLEDFGIFAILLLVVYAYKKILEYYEFKQSSFDDEDDLHNQNDR